MLDITQHWYRQKHSVVTFLLLPFSYLFFLIVSVRRWLYRKGFLQATCFNTPVIVVGNITVGGVGKTPFVIWLAHLLRTHGYHPGIVSRGYGGKANATPVSVSAVSAVAAVGDEAIMLARATNCPVVIGVDRVAAVRELLRSQRCDIVISDDGLQHYRLGRQLEIAIIDATRQFGNRCLLPAGPLREPISRLRDVDFTVMNALEVAAPNSMTLMAGHVIALGDENKKIELTAFPHKRIHAVAGIGNPNKFFTMLTALGFDVIPHAFPDHHQYQAHELEFADSLPILMTEKDAVKCDKFADEKHWFVTATVAVHPELQEKLLQKIDLLEKHHDTEEDFTRDACRINRADQYGRDRE